MSNFITGNPSLHKMVADSRNARKHKAHVLKKTVSKVQITGLNASFNHIIKYTSNSVVNILHTVLSYTSLMFQTIYYESKRNDIHHLHEDINSDTVIIKQVDVRNSPDADTCPVENSRRTERDENQNTIQDSTAFEDEENISELYRTLRNTSCMDDTGIKTELSNSEESNVESDAAKISTDSPELEFLSKNPSMPKYFSTYVEGLRVYGDSYSPLDLKPAWLDVDKFRRGQKVALKYFFGIQFSQMLSLMILFNLPGGLESLIFTGNSDTPLKAFKRYLSTALRVRSWCLDDLWNSETKGHKNLKKVRAMHECLRKNLAATDPEERNKRCTLSGRCDSDCPAIWSTLHKKIQEDFEETCPYSRISQNEFSELYKTRVSVSQTEMGFTQFGFVGLFIAYPACFGAHNITEDELDSFAHLWRCIGYLLGIEDKHNFCNGSLKTVRQKANDIIEFFVKPNFRLVSQEWEHMTRCVTEGVSYYIPGVTFEVSLVYLCNMIGLHTPRLWAALPFKQKICYYFIRFMFWFILRLPGSLDHFNRVVHESLKRVENASPSRLKRWSEKKYPYQENAI